MRINEKAYRFIDKLIRCIYPKHCPVCDEIIPINEDYCRCSRQDSVKISDNYCRHCGHNLKSCSCNSINSFYLPDIAAVYLYGGKVRADILNLKFNNEKHLAVKLGAKMAERCAKVYCDVDFDVVTFVPMTIDAYVKRGYNQGHLLAKEVATRLFISVEPLLVKTRNTAAQHELNGEERTRNLIDAFSVDKKFNIKGKTVLLCDDIKTTGATLNQCVRLLKEAGAERVCCLCVAATEYYS